MDQAKYPSVGHPVLNELDHPFVTYVVEGSYDTLPIIRTFPSKLQSPAPVIPLREGRLSSFGRCIAEGDCI